MNTSSDAHSFVLTQIELITQKFTAAQSRFDMMYRLLISEFIDLIEYLLHT